MQMVHQTHYMERSTVSYKISLKYLQQLTTHYLFNYTKNQFKLIKLFFLYIQL